MYKTTNNNYGIGIQVVLARAQNIMISFDKMISNNKVSSPKLSLVTQL